MRITYLCSLSAVSEAGPIRKIAEQCREWTARGHFVNLVVISQNAYPLPFRLPDSVIVNYHRYPGLPSKLVVTRDLITCLKEFNPDVVYLRYQNAYPYVIRSMAVAPTIVEINGANVRRSLVAEVTHQLNRYWYSTYAAGFVCVTSELKRLCADVIKDKHVRIIRNGTRIDVGRDWRLSNRREKQKAAFFVGNGAPWHGLDRLETIAKAMPDWTFHVVTQKSFSSDSPNVVYHGHLDSRAYGHIMSECSIGIGPLALERAGLTEASALKVTEYLVNGLPIIINYKETDFPADADFVFRMSGDVGEPLELSRLKAFMEKWQQQPFDPTPHLRLVDAHLLEMKRLRFFEEVIASEKNALSANP